MSPKLKEELQDLAFKNREHNFGNYVCLGNGNKQNPLGPYFGIPRDRMFSNMWDKKKLDRGYKGDSPSVLYFLTKEYYNAILDDTTEEVPIDTESPNVFNEIDKQFAKLMGSFMPSSFPFPKEYNEYQKHVEKMTEKESIIGEKSQENVKNDAKSIEMVELQKDFVLRNNLTIGSKVKVLKKYKDYSNKPVVNWASDMDNTIGEVGEIVKIDEDKPSIYVKFKGIEEGNKNPFNPSGDKVWVYAYHSLQPYYDQNEALQLENSYMAVVKDDGSTMMNGLSVTFEELEELYFKAGIAKQSKKKSSGEIDDGSTETWKDSSGDFGF